MRPSFLNRLCLLAIGMFCILFGMLSTAAVAQDLTAAELEADHALTLEVRTPHIQWGKPYAQGKSRVLVFIGARGTVFREAVELLQRFDFDAEAIIYSRIVDTSRDDWHGGKEGIRRMERLLGRDWDAYLFLGVPPSKLPEPLQKKLIGKVLAGRGVVLSGADDPSLTQTVSEAKEAFPFLTGIAGAKPFVPGKGRVVRMPARPTIEYAEGWQNAYETWQEDLGRALLWAAGKEPQSILALSVSRPQFSRNEPEKFTIRWGNVNPGEPRARLQLWLRGPVGWSAPWPDREVTDNQTLVLPVPPLTAGRYHLDGRLVGSDGVLAWATTSFEVTAAQRIASLILANDWGESGDEIAGKVALSGPVAPNALLRIEALDKNRRVLLRHETPAAGEVTVFSFPVPAWLPMLTNVEVTLLVKGEPLATASRYFLATTRKRGSFNFLMWDVPRGTLASYAEEVLGWTGVTLQLAGGNPPISLAANEIAWVPYTTDITAKRDAKGIMTPFCWNDRAAVESRTQKLTDQHLPSRQHGVFAYSLGDEIATQGACLAETCMDTYRSYLKEVYDSLTALNRSWGKDFQTWEAVGLSSPEDNEEKGSFETRNYPRWFDRQAFKSWNFVQYAKRYAEAYRAMDPQAKTGFEGAGRFDRGDDIDLIVRSLGFWAPYPGTADEVVRSIAPRDFPRANWMGYTKDADSLLQKYWRMVTRGMDSVWWWRWECIGKFNGWLAPDFRPYPAVREILTDTRSVREGLGDLLLKSQMQDDGIAILYSYPSTFAHKLEEGHTFTEYQKSHVAWHKAIRDLGLQFSYVTDRMLRLGEFKAKRFRALVLPRAEAIGVKAAAVIRSFVEGGGVVIADTRPGIYDDHCKRRTVGILDDLFGVQRKGFPQARKVSGAIMDPGVEVFGGNEGQVLKQAVDRPQAADTKDQGIERDKRPQFSRLEGTPVLIGRRVGKGYAVLLNGDLNVLTARPPAGIVHLLGNRKAGAVLDQKQGQPSISQSIVFPQFPTSWLAPASPVEPLGVLLESLAGVRPATILRKEDGDPIRDVEIVRWRNGVNEILGLFRQGGKSETVTVRLPRAVHVYDLRNRKSLGETRIFKTAILPNRASFFVLTPKPAPPVQVKIDTEMLGVDPPSPAKVAKAKDKRPAAYTPGTLMKVRLNVPGARGDHAVLVTARFPKPPAETPLSGAFFPRTGYPVMPAVFSPTLRSLDKLGTGAAQVALRPLDKLGMNLAQGVPRQARDDKRVAQGDRGGDQGEKGIIQGDRSKAIGAKDVMLSLSKHDLSEPLVYPGVDPEKGEFLKRVVILGRAPVTVDVPVAYNDPPGTYELTVTDLFTQKTVTRTWTVQ